MQKIESLGFVGLGVMGAPMCNNLAGKSGLPVAGFDNLPEALARVPGAAFHACRSLTEVADHAEVIFFSPCLRSSRWPKCVAGRVGFSTTPNKSKAA